MPVPDTDDLSSRNNVG